MRRWTRPLAVTVVAGLFAFTASAADIPKEGSNAPDFDLSGTQLD